MRLHFLLRNISIRKRKTFHQIRRVSVGGEVTPASDLWTNSFRPCALWPLTGSQACRVNTREDKQLSREGRLMGFESRREPECTILRRSRWEAVGWRPAVLTLNIVGPHLLHEDRICGLCGCRYTARIVKFLTGAGDLDIFWAKDLQTDGKIRYFIWNYVLY